MKKIVFINLFLVCLLVPTILVFGVDILIQDASGKPGDTVPVNIYIHTEIGEEISAFNLDFNYDFSKKS